MVDEQQAIVAVVSTKIFNQIKVPQDQIASIEIVLDDKGNHAVNDSSPLADFVSFGLWDHAFKDETGTLFNEAIEKNNFVGADSRRFYIRVRDPKAKGRGRVKIIWRTRFSNGGGSRPGNIMDSPPDPSLTLLETGKGTSVFTSRALMLVRDNDDKQPVHSGLPNSDPDGGMRSNTMSNYRIRLGGMFGFVEVEYPPTSSKSTFVPVFQRNPDKRKRLPLQIVVLRETIGGKSIIDPIDEIFNRDLRIVAEIYERLGIFVQTTVGIVDPKFNPVIKSGGNPIKYDIILADPPSGVGGLLSEDDRNKKIAPSFPALPDTIRVFYAGQFKDKSALGLSNTDIATLPSDAFRGTSFIDPLRRFYTVAHEIGHILTNKPSGKNGGHFETPGIPLTNNQNLMNDNPDPSSEGFDKPKRLWDANDTSGFNQYIEILGSHYLRAL